MLIDFVPILPEIGMINIQLWVVNNALLSQNKLEHIFW